MKQDLAGGVSHRLLEQDYSGTQICVLLISLDICVLSTEQARQYKRIVAENQRLLQKLAE